MRAPLALVILLTACGGGTGAGDGDSGVDAGLDASSDAGTDAGADAGTDAGGDASTLDDTPPYPVVLAHGFFGFEDFAGAGFLTYFYEVREHMASVGEDQVFTPTVDPFNDSTTRGMQLIDRIEEIRAMTGKARVNLIGHSQGGLDARVVAHLRPDMVASVTSLATPNRGTPISDVILRLVEDDRFARLVDALVRLVGGALFDEVGMETSLVAGLRQFSGPGIAEFNATYTNVPAVAYYSVTGRTDRHPGGTDCRPDREVTFVSGFDRTLDPVDPLLAIPEEILDGGLFDPIPNDGLVRVRDARWGTFLGCIPADHLDEVGQLLGDEPGLLNDFDHKRFFEDLIAFLRDEGF